MEGGGVEVGVQLRFKEQKSAIFFFPPPLMRKEKARGEETYPGKATLTHLAAQPQFQADRLIMTQLTMQNPTMSQQRRWWHVFPQSSCSEDSKQDYAFDV